MTRKTNSANTGLPSLSGIIDTPEVWAPDYTEPTGDYIGYAQWTSREVWQLGRDKSDAELQTHRQAMRECCAEVEVLYELDVTDDWLQGEVYGGME